MPVLKVTQIGNSVGVVFPREMLAHLKVEKGDTVFLTEMPGGYRLTPYDPDFERSMTLVDEIMDEYRDTLKELAK